MITLLLPIADFDWYITNEPFRERYDEQVSQVGLRSEVV